MSKIETVLLQHSFGYFITDATRAERRTACAQDILASLNPWVSVDDRLPTGETDKKAWLVKFAATDSNRTWEIYHASRTGDQMAHLIKVAEKSPILRAIAWMEIPPMEPKTFECVWCRDHALETPDVYTMDVIHIGGTDEETGLPICDGCADSAQELPDTNYTGDNQ